MMLAYLDPGTGSALVGTVIALAGAGLYSLKSFVYRFAKKERVRECVLPDIAIFSEGKNYWGTFREIIEELISRRIHFSYFTMDLHDPALLIDNEYMHSRLYDKNSIASYHKLSNLKAKILLSTTPNIGTPGFPIRRSPNVGQMAHVFHAFADISAYHVGSLDCYDIVYAVGPHQEKPIREVEGARNLGRKRIVSVGLPYFDAQYRALNMDTRDEVGRSAHPTILIGPSWGAKGLLSEYGTGFILDLSKAGYNVIIRPHPQSIIAEPDLLERCKEETSICPNVTWDLEPLGTASMKASDLLISDTSSIRFDYAFLYGKPVITLDIPHEKQMEYEGQFMSEIWTDKAARKLGRVLDHSTICSIVSTVGGVLKDGTMSIGELRDGTITNLGTSAKAVVNLLLREVA